MQRFFIAALCAAIVFIAPPLVHAQENWPDKPVKIVVPYPAGPGSADTIARIVGEQLAKQTGQPFVVDNKPGASGNISTDFAIKSSADGYTLLLSAIGPIAMNPSIFRNLPFDPLKDLQAVTYVGGESYVLVTHPSVGARTVKDFVALGKAQRDRHSFASSGVGSGTHVTAELFQLATGAKLLHIPYKGGTQAMNDLLAGSVSSTFTSVPLAANYVKAGKLQALMVTGAERAPSLPDIPTAAEAGFPEAAFSGWYGFFLPARTPRPLVDRIHAQITAALGQPDVHRRIEELGVHMQSKSTPEFGDFVRSESDRLGRVIRAARITLD